MLEPHARDEFERLAYAISHDLGSPVRHLEGFSRLLVSSLGEDATEQQLEYAQLLEVAAASLKARIALLSEQGRVLADGQALEPVDLNGVVAAALQGLAPQVRAGGADVRVPEGLPVLAGRPRLLERLFECLFGNALQFASPDRQPIIELTVHEGPDGCELRIIDNGRGLPERQWETSFLMFRKMNHETPGQGSGLALSRSIVRRHGGRIWLSSAEGADGGLVVHVLLPMERAS